MAISVTNTTIPTLPVSTLSLRAEKWTANPSGRYSVDGVMLWGLCLSQGGDRFFEAESGIGWE